MSDSESSANENPEEPQQQEQQEEEVVGEYELEENEVKIPSVAGRQDRAGIVFAERHWPGKAGLSRHASHGSSG